MKSKYWENPDKARQYVRENQREKAISRLEIKGLQTKDKMTQHSLLKNELEQGLEVYFVDVQFPNKERQKN